MSDYAMIITCKLNRDDTEVTTLVIPTVSESTVNATSTVTTHPIVTGEQVADHMYDEPDSMSFSGSFSLNGSKGIVLENRQLKLADYQELFEKIKKNGIICDIVKAKIDDKNADSVSFKIRRSMVLTSITWTERVNSLSFSFNFTQVRTVEVQAYDVDTTDSFLPNLEEPQTLNFTDVLLDWNQVDALLNSQLFSLKLMTQQFIDNLKSYTSTQLVALGVGVAVAAAIVIAFSVPVAGWIAGAVVAIGIFAIGIFNRVKAVINQHKYLVEQFKYYEDDRKMNAEITRYADFVGAIHQQLYSLNDVIKVYSVGSSVDQECFLSINDNYYIFTFTKNSSTNTYDLVIKDADNSNQKVVNDISGTFTSFDQLRNDNCQFRSGNYRTYLVRLADDAADLTGYYIVVANTDLDKFQQTVSDIIINALTR